MNINPIQNWLPHNRPLLISGPCSAETEEQVIETSKLIASNTDCKILRAGIWKPRTRPNSFEGVGAKGLKWLKKAGKETGLLTATEVANANHAELCLKYEIDIIWIGARTSANPFSVQEIADVIKGEDIPVFVKNPVNPDLQLWIGALERINQAGIHKLAAIHRGFSTYENTPYRNVPNWEIPIELKRNYPTLPVICDPSHIAGDSELIEKVCQKALDLDMNGLMIESHQNPKEAWSDAKQQITPSRLGEMMKGLQIRNSTVDNDMFKDALSKLRQEIDTLDDKLFENLTSRMHVVKQIGAYKRDNDVTILQVNRWEEIVTKRIKETAPHNLSDEFITKLLNLVHKESIRIQTEIMNKK